MQEKSETGYDRLTGGVLVPLFALRGKSDLGCGDTEALREFVIWAADHGFRLVQLLPVNETGSDNSPYNAISSVAIEPATIELSAVPDLQHAEIEAVAHFYREGDLRSGPVKWSGVKALKRELLRRAFVNFCDPSRRGNESRAREFAEFTKAEAGWLDAYALFRLLMEIHGTEHWSSWPQEVRSADSARAWVISQTAERRADIDRDMRYFKYVQWQAFSQWRAMKADADQRGVLLMGDVPFGVNYHSADVWAEPELFDLKWSGGAPPEPAFTDDEFIRKWGQNWGVPLYRWPAHRATGFAWWRRRVRKVGDAFHLFRIDHALGFFRIYGFPWRPERNAEFLPLTEQEVMERTGGDVPRFHEFPDDTPEHCEANRAQGVELLEVLQAEVGPRALVGEDLGVVPDYVRPSLQKLGIPGFKVPLWEVEHDLRLIPRDKYERCSIATFATHDHEPLCATWEKWMSVVHAALNEPERLGEQRNFAWREARRLAEWADFEVPCIMAFEEVHERLLAALFCSGSWLAVVMITDLLGTTQRFNIPGSVGDGNWSARLPSGWETTYAEKAWRVSRLLRSAGR